MSDESVQKKGRPRTIAHPSMHLTNPELASSGRCVEWGCDFHVRMVGSAARHILRVMNRHMLKYHPEAVRAFRDRFPKKRKRTIHRDGDK